MSDWLTLLLIAVRLGGISATAPFLSRREIPALVKIALVWAIALAVLPSVSGLEPGGMNYLPLVVCEAVYGLALGWGASLLFQAFQGAGHLLDQQAGFGMASWFDPSMGQVSIMSRFTGMLGLMLFLAMDGHHLIVISSVSSFELMPPGLGLVSSGMVQALVNGFILSFLFVLRFSAPVMAVLFVTDILLGLLGKTVPQLNVLMMGLPVKSLVAVLVLGAMLPAYLDLTHSLLSEMMKLISGMLEGGL